MRLQEQMVPVQLDKPAHADLRSRHVKAAAVVGVSEIAGGREQEADRTPARAIARGTHGEDAIVGGLLEGVGNEPDRVDPALKVIRQSDGEIRPPAGVGHVVGVEVDGAVEIGPAAPVERLTRPSPPGAGARRSMDGAAVQPVRRGIAYEVGLDLAREVPIGEEPRVPHQPGGLGEQAHRLLGRKAGFEQRGAVDLAVEMRGRPC